MSDSEMLSFLCHLSMNSFRHYPRFIWAFLVIFSIRGFMPVALSSGSGANAFFSQKPFNARIPLDLDPVLADCVNCISVFALEMIISELIIPRSCFELRDGLSTIDIFPFVFLPARVFRRMSMSKSFCPGIVSGYTIWCFLRVISS